MPGRPTPSDVHVDSIRTELSIAYMNERQYFAGDAIAPLCPVNKQSDKYATFDRGDFMRIQMELGASGAPAPIMEFGTSSDTYFCDKYHGKAFLPDELLENADEGYALDKAYVEFVTHQALLQRDKLIADNFWTTGIWGTDKTPGTKWSATSSTPYEDLRTGCRTIQQAIGRWPTDLILGADVADTLIDHPDTLDRVKGGATSNTPATVKLEAIAAELKLKRVTEAAAVYNTASAGATVSMSPLFDTNDALLIYRPDSPAKFTPSGAYTFVWSPFDGVQGARVGIKTWRQDDPDGEYFRGMIYVDPKVTASEAGYFFNEATS